MANDLLVPPIADDSGYCIRERDLRFLDVDIDQVDRWRDRSAPLGMSHIQYRAFVDELAEALAQDGISARTCDARLKGSAAGFYSGHHKKLPTSTDEVIDLFRELRGRYPAQWEISEIVDRLTRRWVTDGSYPLRRPFDSLLRLGLSQEPSDIDLQLSDDRLLKRCEALLISRGQPLTDARLSHPTYDFVRKDLVDSVCPHLYLFSLRMSDALGRHVSVAVFPSDGPPNRTSTHGDISAHHRSDDWQVRIRRLQPETLS